MSGSQQPAEPEALTPPQAVRDALRAELLKYLPGLGRDELTTLALRLSRVLDPGAPVGAVAAGRLTGYAAGVRSTRDYVRSYVVNDRPIAAVDAGRMMAGLNESERRAAAVAARARP